MNKLRIQVMNTFRRSDGEDRKKYHRLKILEAAFENETILSYTNYKYFSLFGQTTDATVLATLLKYDESLKVKYELYQSLLNSMKEKDFPKIKSILQSTLKEGVSRDFLRSIRTLKHSMHAIKNRFIYPFNNVRIEGINNKIKVLNRVACGYWNFTNYRNRIFIHFKLKRAS